jgi:hypothetical protein
MEEVKITSNYSKKLILRKNIGISMEITGRRVMHASCLELKSTKDQN